VEDHLTAISPSSSLLVICSKEARKREGNTTERLLSVGNPSFDHSEFPELAELPSAEREAKQIVRFYDSSCLLTGSAAVKPRVEMEMERADVIHFAVHSVLDQHSPLRSKLVLARKPGSSGSQAVRNDALEAREIYKTRLSRTRMVVLSACQSGVEQYYGGEGMISLARPFLAASVPLVVVSLWPADSDFTAELMISFHKHRQRDNVSSAEALRQAQLDMLSSPDEDLRQPYCWAAFTAVGGWTSF
jgi:CHAT domain-containing protein